MGNLVAKPNIVFKSPSGDRIEASSSTKDFIIRAKKEADLSVITSAGSATRTWKFDGAGNITLPQGGDILDSTGNSVFGDEFTIPALLDYALIADLSDAAFSGSYNDLLDKPTISYNDLTNKPSLFSGSYNDLANKPTLFSGSYNDLTNKPPSNFSGSYNDLIDTPTIPTLTSELTNDSGFLTSVTNITGNAGTVTNGVYTTGAQTIGGAKTFTNTVAVNGLGGITTTATTFPLINTSATTVNFAGAATALNIGAGTGTTTVNNDLYVAGNITFGGTSTTLSATNLDVTDALIYLAIENEADILDIGWVGAYNESSTHKHSGLVRDASDGKWKLFSGITAEPTTVVDFTGATYDTLKANLEGSVTGNLSGNVTGNVTGNITGNLTGDVTGSVSGNAGTVTNGVYTSGSYSDPSWITAIAKSKISGLGTVADQDADAVTITGGSLTNLSEISIVGGTFILTNNSSSTAFRITQTGTGKALLVEDSTNPDSTPFCVEATGKVGIGTLSPAEFLTLDVPASNQFIRFDKSTVFQGLVGVAQGSGQGSSLAATGDMVLRSELNRVLIDTAGTTRTIIDASGNVLPAANAAYNLGSVTFKWANIYTGDLHLSNESKGGNDVDGTTGNWTIQEGTDSLFIINNKSGKKYKFALEEIA